MNKNSYRAAPGHFSGRKTLQTQWHRRAALPCWAAWIPGACHSAGRGINYFCLEETCSGHYELFGRKSSDISALGSSRKRREHGKGPIAKPQQLLDGNEAAHQLWGRAFVDSRLIATWLIHVEMLLEDIALA